MRKRSGLTVALIVLAMTVWATAITAATLTVTNLNDSGAGSLRDQLVVAGASTVADNIVFQASLSGTITLASELVYASNNNNNDVSIDGSVTAGVITVSGSSAVRCFRISGSGILTCSITNLSFTNGRGGGFWGNSGGGILVTNANVSTVMSNVTVSNCVAPAGAGSNGGGLDISAGVAVTLNNCMFSANSSDIEGGGACIITTGTVTVTGCTFNANTAANAGGGARIDSLNTVVSNCTFGGNGASSGAGASFGAPNSATINVSGCTFSGNTAASGGGGVTCILNGGGAPTVTMNFTNCTVSGNTCNASGTGGGILAQCIAANNMLTVTLTNCTIANNTSATPANGISICGQATNGGTITFGYRNTIISGTGNTNIVAITGGVTFTSQNNNLCTDATGNLIGANDLPSTTANLGALANNGGPTQTHVPQPGSAAIDKGRFITGITTDQRGVAKPLDNPLVVNASNGDGSDIGAVEAPLPPTLTNVSPAAGPLGGGQAVTLTGTNFTGATSVTFAGTAAGSLVVVSSTSITCTTPAGSAGTASVIVTTPAGSNAANTLYTYQAQPTLTGVVPPAGPTAGGQSVTLTGTNFTGATSVTFAGTPAGSVVVVSSTSITCTTPSGTAGTASVVVTTPGGSNVANTLYTYQAAPTVTLVTPATGALGGGQSVTITGTNFTGVTGVTFGGAAASSIVVVSITSITCTTPAHAVGAVSVLVTTPGGVNAANTLFTYQNAPTLSAVNATSGPDTGGTSVTLTGLDFTGATGVTFGGAAAGTVVVVSDTSITCTTPVHASGPVSVVVTTFGGSNAANTFFLYTSTTAPTLTLVTPAVGPLAGGQSVTLTGTDFFGTTGVTFAGNPATTVVVVSATSITCTTPSGLAGSASVVVTNLAGSNAANTLFTYTSSPIVTLVNPSTGPIAGGTAVTITGSNLAGATTVTFGGTAATALVVVSSSSITCTAPAHAPGVVSVNVTTPSGTNSANTLFEFVAPEMDITRGFVAVADGALSDPLGTIAFGVAQTVTYTITNNGTAPLQLTGVPNLVVVAGVANISSVLVTTPPTSSTVVPAGTSSFTLTYMVTSAAAFSFTVSIANNDANEDPYTWTANGTGALVPEISISRGATAIADGGADAVGTVSAGSAAGFTYNISNTGNNVLTLTLPIVISGLSNCTATVTTAPASASVPASTSGAFIVTVTPLAAGSFGCTVAIMNDDPDEGTYTWNMTGTADAGGGGGGGGGGSDSGGCSTADDHNALLQFAGAIAILGLGLRLRRRIA